MICKEVDQVVDEMFRRRGYVVEERNVPMHKPTKEELQTSRLTWNTLRQSDRRILCTEAKLPSQVWWECIAWDDLTENQRLALMQFDWNSAFAAA